MPSAKSVLFILLGILALTTAGLFILNALPEGAKPEEAGEIFPSAPKGVSAPESGATQVTGDSSIPPGSTVVYTSEGFRPSSIILRQNDKGDGCFIAISNASGVPLLVRLSPHDPKDGWGSQFPEIAPGQTILIDPKYRISKIAFHNYRNLAQEFSVTLGEGCSEF